MTPMEIKAMSEHKDDTQPATREQLLRSFARRFKSGVSSEDIAEQYDEYQRLGALDVKWDAEQGEWEVKLKSPGPKN